MTLGEMSIEAHREQADYCVPEGVSVGQLSSSVRFDRSGHPDGERMVDRSGQPDEQNSVNAQIRTLLEEQGRTTIAQYREQVSHHELQAAQAEERRLLQGQLWRQKLEFREAHQQSLTEMEESRKSRSAPPREVKLRRPDPLVKLFTDGFCDCGSTVVAGFGAVIWDTFTGVEGLCFSLTTMPRGTA